VRQQLTLLLLASLVRHRGSAALARRVALGPLPPITAGERVTHETEHSYRGRFRIKEAADLLGVSYDTMLRWADGGRIGKLTDSSGRLVVDGAALAELARERAESAATADGVPVAAQSVRNRFTGLVTRVVKDTVMAQVEIQAGPHRFVSLLSREAADELGLEPGMLATAAVKATNVAVEIPAAAVRRPGPRPG
jgi:molybdopterin-binding protein